MCGPFLSPPASDFSTIRSISTEGVHIDSDRINATCAIVNGDCPFFSLALRSRRDRMRF